MREIQITEVEYNKLIQRLEFFDTMRNQLLIFSFTSVLTILGVAIGININSTNVWVCLVPFLLIIPFAARISYYRLASAHINSFLKRFAQRDIQFELGTNIVIEGRCKHFKLIAWLVNHEMVLLGIATSCVFYFEYIVVVKNFIFWNYIILIIPLIFNWIIYIITDSTYSYKDLMNNFLSEWDKYINTIK